MPDDLRERIALAIEARLSYVVAQRAALIVPRTDPISEGFRKGHDAALREAARIAREMPIDAPDPNEDARDPA